MEIIMRSKWKKVMMLTGFVGVCFYLSINLAFYFLQDRITFMPQPITEERLEQMKTINHVEEIALDTTDNTTIHGWLLNRGDGPSPLLIYFGGNAEEVSHFITQYIHNDLPYSVLAINYRGYGLSEGAPSEETMFHDALTIYDYAITRNDVDEERIAVMGRSMGTGVAVYLAYKRELERVLLVSPYDSLTHVAQNRYPFLPVNRLINHHFNNIDRAPEIQTPLLTLIATEDRIIPPYHSKDLVESWDGPSQYLLFEGYGHNSIQNSPNYWMALNDFFSQ